jgi:(p)ppGpp synthase/HD superfamily hydrolase
MPSFFERGTRRDVMTLRLEEAMRFAAKAHAGQLRRGSDTPYFVHVAAVALILERAGFGEDVVVAGLLHDVVEDTATGLEKVAIRFGENVSELVRCCSEVKTDEHGNKRPWLDRKREHLAALSAAPIAARGIILADKLHNLVSIELDLRENQPVWRQFHAEREQVLWYYRSAIELCGRGDARLESLAASCWDVLARIERWSDAAPP